MNAQPAAAATADERPIPPVINMATEALDGWMAAYDANTGAREVSVWGVTFANSIKRALEAGNTSDAHALACIQQQIFDGQFAIAETGAREAKQHVNALRARGAA